MKFLTSLTDKGVGGKQRRQTEHKGVCNFPSPHVSRVCAYSVLASISVLQNCLQILTTDDYPYRVMAFLSCDLSVDVAMFPVLTPAFQMLLLLTMRTKFLLNRMSFLTLLTFKEAGGEQKKQMELKAVRTFPAFLGRVLTA